MKNLPLKWFGTLTGEGKKNFHQLIVTNATNKVIIRLREIIEQQKKEIERLELTPAEYDNPSWATKQAYFNGQKYAMKQILDLLEFTQK